MNKPWDYNKIMSNKKKFYATVYTPFSEAIKILEERQKDTKLREKIEGLLDGDIPEPLQTIGIYGISCKQVATPNFDTQWLLSISNKSSIKPVFFEYLDDKFTSNNSFKHALGQLMVYDGTNKKGEDKVKKITIIDFNKSNGKRLRDVFTLWSESLIDFHRKLFKAYNFDTKSYVFYDESAWLKRNGGKAENYYERDLLLYVYHGILFENFLLTGSEGKFTKEVFLPALEKVTNISGMKPIIVPIPPMDNEENMRGCSYDKKILPYIKKSELMI